VYLGPVIGWSSRSRRSSEHEKWLASLTPLEREEEALYQRMVNRRFFPLFGLFGVISLVSVGVAAKWASPRDPFFLGILLVSLYLPYMAPFLCIPTKERWKERRRWFEAVYCGSVIRINAEEGEVPPQATVCLYLLAHEYEAIFARVAQYDAPTPEQGLAAIAAVLGQETVDRMQGEVVGMLIVEELPDDRFERL
jgi:hypothetical protein